MAETTYTDHYSLPKPARGAISWDDEINGALDIIDGALNDNAVAITALQDAAISTLFASLTDGQMLVWDEDALGSEPNVGAWINANIPDIPDEVSDLGDVIITSIANGQGLVWDETANGGVGAFVNSAAAGGSTTLAGLIDVVITSIADGQVITWDEASSKFINADPAGSVIDEINDIGDVSNPTPANLVGGEVLAFNKATENWEPAAMQVNDTPPVFQFQAGSVAVTASSSQAVLFSQEFSGAPYVTLGAVYGTATGIQTPHISVAPTVSGFTVYNPNAFDITVHWHAVKGGTGGGSGSVVVGDEIPDVGSSFISVP